MHPERKADPFATAVAQALELAPRDQQRLADLLHRLAGAPSAGAGPEAGNGEQQQQAQQQPQVPAAEDPQDAEAASLEEWLSSIASEKPWQRLLLLEEASAQELTQAQQHRVSEAISELLAAHPEVSVRRAVQTTASERPWHLLVGVAGLGLALWAFGRGVFRLLF